MQHYIEICKHLWKCGERVVARLQWHDSNVQPSYYYLHQKSHYQNKSDPFLLVSSSFQTLCVVKAQGTSTH